MKFSTDFINYALFPVVGAVLTAILVAVGRVIFRSAVEQATRQARETATHETRAAVLPYQAALQGNANTITAHNALLANVQERLSRVEGNEKLLLGFLQFVRVGVDSGTIPPWPTEMHENITAAVAARVDSYAGE